MGMYFCATSLPDRRNSTTCPYSLSSVPPLVDPRKRPLHDALGVREVAESDLAIQRVSVPGHEHPSAKPLEARVREDRFHQPGREPLPAVRFENEDVGEIGEGREVRDDPREPDLSSVLVESETKGTIDRPVDDLARDLCRPVGGDEKTVNRLPVELRRIR